MPRLEIVILLKEEIPGMPITAVLGSSRGFGKSIEDAVADLFTAPIAAKAALRFEKLAAGASPAPKEPQT